MINEGVSMRQAASAEQPGEDSQQRMELLANDFAVVKVQGKTKDSVRLYIYKILRVSPCGYDAPFYKRIPKTQRFSETEEEGFLAPQDIHTKLSKPIMCTSGRFVNTITFHDDLSDLTIY
uniref:Holliday junction ATP-dependent DNA helicase RuvB n=1 Tax=Lygus hesperus TaxID=30085 RepID=A0A0A9XYL3_LYGHE